jgi:uncharacterized protein YhbP (UPF0306 family)
MNNEVLQAQVLRYLYEHHVMTLATTGPHGVWAAALFYANKDFTFIFLSAGHTRHAQNIAANPRAAATIQENYANWEEIKGIQLEGIVTQLQGEERAATISFYTAKFAFMNQANSAMQMAIAKVNWYQLNPDKLYFIDNSQGLGHRTEILLP